MRVTGGRLAGRRLRAPRGGRVRPTADRVRESLFARLGPWADVRVLDAFAGTGALGIEALSRGAARAVFVERSATALAALRANLEALALADASRVVRGDARAVARRLARAGERFEWIFLDPPYGDEALGEVLEQAAGLLSDAGEIVVETSRHDPLPEIAGLAILDARPYGDTLVTRLGPARGGEVGSGVRGGRHEAVAQPTATVRGMNMSQSVGERVALFPASFDPVTNGHLDIIRRSLKLVDRLVVAVAHNVAKSGAFTVEERLDILQAVLGDEPRIEITAFEGLLVDFCRSSGAEIVIRGLRAMSDYEYEFEMALMNKHLNPDVETVFMMASQEYLYVSSSRLKELVRHGGNVSDFVPPLVEKRLREKLQSG